VTYHRDATVADNADEPGKVCVCQMEATGARRAPDQPANPARHHQPGYSGGTRASRAAATPGATLAFVAKLLQKACLKPHGESGSSARRDGDGSRAANFPCRDEVRW
jgi:hypothetical protein